MTKTTPGLLDPEHTVLLVIDVQVSFARVMAGFQGMVERCARMARVFSALELPVMATEQYPRGLGGTVPLLRNAMLDSVIAAKTCFSSASCDEVQHALAQAGASTVLVCGVEAHVCVSQTVHELVAAGYAPHVLVDCVLSRNEHDRVHALERMKNVGAILTTSEAATFELIRDAKHPRFKEVQQFFL